MLDDRRRLASAYERFGAATNDLRRAASALSIACANDAPAECRDNLRTSALAFDAAFDRIGPHLAQFNELAYRTQSETTELTRTWVNCFVKPYYEDDLAARKRANWNKILSALSSPGCDADGCNTAVASKINSVVGDIYAGRCVGDNPEPSRRMAWLHTEVQRLAFGVLQSESDSRGSEGSSTGYDKPLSPLPIGSVVFQSESDSRGSEGSSTGYSTGYDEPPSPPPLAPLPPRRRVVLQSASDSRGTEGSSTRYDEPLSPPPPPPLSPPPPPMSSAQLEARLDAWLPRQMDKRGPEGLAGVPSDERTLATWRAFEKDDWKLTVAEAQICVKALAEWGLTEANSSMDSLLPIGVVDDDEKYFIHERGAMNDLATCLVVGGWATEKLGNLEEAYALYYFATYFRNARTWDPKNGTFWSPSDMACQALTAAGRQCR